MTHKDIPYHMYIGQRIEWRPKEHGVMEGFNLHGIATVHFDSGERKWVDPTECKLILRRLDSMTEAEAIEFTIADDTYFYPDDEERVKTAKNIIKGGEFNPAAFLYLLSRGFWLFGEEAFEEGLVIDKDKIGVI